MKEKNVKLLEPVVVGGEERAEVTIRRSTVGDEEDAMDMAIRLKRPKNSVTVEVCMFSKLTKLPYDAIRSMCGQELHGAARSAERAERPGRRGPYDGSGDGWDAGEQLGRLRAGMLQLGRFSNWPRSDIREMTPAEFAGYVQAATGIVEDEYGS